MPGSARTSSGTVVPALDGWFGDVSALSTTLHIAIVAPKGMLTGPAVAGAEPAKSTMKRAVSDGDGHLHAHRVGR